MKLIATALLLTISFTTSFASATERKKFVLKCDNGKTIELSKLIVGQTPNSRGQLEQYVSARNLRGVQTELYWHLGDYKEVFCEVELAK